ncbi:MAG: MBL fold metallo-hydrolase [Anaerolineae bacterium]|jgi:glyoxylase-like metal-dependent hydrolase (beta-lactamase superfamily II)|nr:MBL fold metallo-hydrolase [Anaerolineae bacterium]
MQRERITEAIYVFTSELYVQVTAGVVLTSEGAVVIDTLLYPEETQQMRRFVEERLGARVAYVINTHHHADHTTGTCFFPGARVIGHELCRHLLDTRGRDSLARSRAGYREMADVSLVLPDLTFEDRLTLRVGEKTLQLWASPGHSPDSIVCLVEEDQVLFAADTVMPLPYFVDGSHAAFLQSLHSLRGRGFETIVQGHGEVILRGEVEARLKSDIVYLEKLQTAVDKALALPGGVDKALEAIRLEACGKSPVLLNGAVRQLHRQNVLALAQLRGEHGLLKAGHVEG